MGVGTFHEARLDLKHIKAGIRPTTRALTPQGERAMCKTGIHFAGTLP